MRQISRLTQESTFSKTGRWCQSTNPEKETPPLILIVIYLYTVEYTFSIAGVGAGRWWFMALYCQLEGMVSFISDLPMSSHNYQSPISDYHRAVLLLASWSVISCCQHVFFYMISLLNRHGVMSLCLQAAQHWRSFKDTTPSALVIAALPTESIASKVTLHFLNSRLTCGCQALLHDNDMQVWAYQSFTFCKQGHSVCDCENGLIGFQCRA